MVRRAFERQGVHRTVAVTAALEGRGSLEVLSGTSAVAGPQETLGQSSRPEGSAWIQRSPGLGDRAHRSFVTGHGQHADEAVANGRVPGVDPKDLLTEVSCNGGIGALRRPEVFHQERCLEGAQTAGRLEVADRLSVTSLVAGSPWPGR